MAECVAENRTTAAGETLLLPGWSVGVIATSGGQLPSACLQHCLDNDPALALSHGCPMVRRLVEKAQGGGPACDGGAAACPAPQRCEQGYAVSLLEADGMSSPDVLVLRPPVAGPEADEAVAPAVQAVQSAVAEAWRLNHENDGLADEVLRSYEQVNFIFDISAESMMLSDGDEVRRALLTQLRHMFHADAVFLVLGDELTAIQVDHNGHALRGWVAGHAGRRADASKTTRAGSWDMPEVSTIELPPEFNQARDRLAESQRVFVSTTEAGGGQAGYGTAMWGALTDDEKSFSIVGIVRRHTPFSSGDMLLLDSTLTFGGHILRNLRLVEQLRQSSFEVVRTLVNAIDQKDRYTSGHSERVGLLAKATGQSMGLPGKQLKELEWAALLHDVGKIGVPEQVLHKPGRLTDEEYAVVKGHPSRGHEILEPVASLEPVLEGVLHHHENPDGTGYPDGLKGDDIPLLARIIHVVDVFDALTSTRSYRQAYGPRRALDILKRDAGTKLDAEIVERFLETWARLPVTHPQEHEQWFGARKKVMV